jgi:hypothetical protein
MEAGLRVPNAELAHVDEDKILHYLLSDTHPVGRAKAEFFRSLGFAVDQPDELRKALLALVRLEEVVVEVRTDYGEKYAVDGMIVGRDGAARVRTVWIVDRGATVPRLITAYPSRLGGSHEGA